MKTWVAMYTLIWLAFLEIVFVLFSPLAYLFNVGIHAALGVGVLALAFYVRQKVRPSGCPARIKRITSTTLALAAVQGLLGVALAAGNAFSWGPTYAGVVSFLHVVNGIAIITQASSSATAYDMWEEKEFEVAAQR